MVKGNYHATFDPKLYTEFVAVVGKGNVKRALEDYMINTLAVYNKDINKINIKIIGQEIDDLTKKLSKTQAILSRKVEIRDRFLKESEEKELIKLKIEKETIENAKKCLKCGSILSEKHQKVDVKGGFVCKSCWHTAEREDYVRWSE